MKTKIYLCSGILISFICISCGIPYIALAQDVGAGAQTVPTFENQQHLTLSIKANTVDIPDQSTPSIIVGTSTTFSYQINRAAPWPDNYDVATATQEADYAAILGNYEVHLELWKGFPFSSSAKMLQTWDITNQPSGKVTATLPEAAPYFFIAYVPDGFYQDLQIACPEDDDWKDHCAPTYTLDNLRAYFSIPLGTAPSLFFQHKPLAFGGVAFTVSDAPVQQQASNVLFLPGTITSKLFYRNKLGIVTQVWEPWNDTQIPLLGLKADGTSENDIYVGDIIDYLYNFSVGSQKYTYAIYGPFEDFMNSLVAKGTIKAWRPYSYDWRYDVQDIVKNGTERADGSHELLPDVVQQLAATSPTGKVTIIGHSNGGLLAKALAIELQKEGKSNLVDKIILVGTPQFGTPKTLQDMLHGDEFTTLGGIITSGATVRDVAKSMPGMYGILPSTEYFNHVSNPLIMFSTDPLLKSFRTAYGNNIDTYAKMVDFITDASHVYALSPGTDLNTPISLSSALLSKEKGTHAALDNWVPPADIELSTIASWGQPTPYEYYYSPQPGQWKCNLAGIFAITCGSALVLEHSSSKTLDGDDTVVSPSALGTHGQLLYFDAYTYQKDSGIHIVHSNLLSAAPIQSQIVDLLSNSSSTEKYIQTQKPINSTNPLTVIGVHSPVNPVVTDSSGNESGIVLVPGTTGIYHIEQNIPGSYVEVLDDEKYVYLPPSTNYSVAVHGYANGKTTITIGNVDAAGVATTTQTFLDIPTTASTTGTFTITNNQASAPAIDVNGDGVVDLVASTSPGVVNPTTPGLLALYKLFVAYSSKPAVKLLILVYFATIEGMEKMSGSIPIETYIQKTILAATGIKLSQIESFLLLQFINMQKT